jgi:hypothetical protein
MYGGAITANAVTPSVNMKSRIINGAMVIDQRNAGASVTPANTDYTLDRWRSLLTQSSKYTVQRNAGSVTPPAGFTNYLGVTSSSAYSVVSSDYFVQQQFIEGFNTADLAFGTANAKTITVSFWVRSSLTGTFGGSVFNNDGSRCYAFTYTISSASTWEQKSITIAGDTTGTWNTTNLCGLGICFGLGVGSTNSISAGAWGSTFGYSATGATSVVGTNGATFYITGVQLEVGSTATSFDYRPYGTELQLCMRYAQQIGQGAAGRVGGTNYAELGLLYAVPMRAGATISFGGFPGAQNKVSEPGFGDLTMTSINAGPTAKTGAYLVPGFTGGTAGRIALILSGDAFFASAEL